LRERSIQLLLKTNGVFYVSFN